eukprot:Skav209860  [mRNA]  locus=scaffold1684:387803:393480:- [translate_table: standard]
MSEPVGLQLPATPEVAAEASDMDEEKALRQLPPLFCWVTTANGLLVIDDGCKNNCKVDFLKELLDMTEVQRADLIAGEITEAKQHLDRATRIASAFDRLRDDHPLVAWSCSSLLLAATQVVLELQKELDKALAAKRWVQRGGPDRWR